MVVESWALLTRRFRMTIIEGGMPLETGYVQDRGVQTRCRGAGKTSWMLRRGVGKLPDSREEEAAGRPWVGSRQRSPGVTMDPP